jgi:predicted kinase
MTKLIITRGLPGSGKSTFARAWVAEDPAQRAEVNRDQLRKMLHDGVFIRGRDGTENAVTGVRDAAIKSLLSRGVDVMCSDTNLPQRVARDLRNLADATGADFEVQDFTDVPWDVCVERDQGRGSEGVGAEVIMGMHSRFLAGAKFPLPIPERAKEDAPPADPYVPKPGAPAAVLVDIDGTMALMGDRSPYDWQRVGEDRPNEKVVELVRWLYARDEMQVIFLSGRDGSCELETVDWLTGLGGFEGALLFMRAEGDTRKDSVVKLELFDEHIRDNYDVRFVLDDRNQVVSMWRSIGLDCFQVAEGDF